MYGAAIIQWAFENQETMSQIHNANQSDIVLIAEKLKHFQFVNRVAELFLVIMIWKIIKSMKLIIREKMFDDLVDVSRERIADWISKKRKAK